MAAVHPAFSGCSAAPVHIWNVVGRSLARCAADPGSNWSRLRARDTRHTSPQPLIPRVLCTLACCLDGFLGRTLAAGNLDCFAAGDFVARIVRHPPEEKGGYR